MSTSPERMRARFNNEDTNRNQGSANLAISIVCQTLSLDKHLHYQPFIQLLINPIKYPLTKLWDIQQDKHLYALEYVIFLTFKNHYSFKKLNIEKILNPEILSSRGRFGLVCIYYL